MYIEPTHLNYSKPIQYSEIDKCTEEFTHIFFKFT